jgi:hypothetical protein
MVTVNTAASTGDVVKRNRFWWGRMALCVTRCTRTGTPVVGCPQFHLFRSADKIYEDEAVVHLVLPPNSCNVTARTF